MDNNVPFIVFETEMTRLERTIRRLTLLLLLTILLLFISNVAWLTFFNQFDVETENTETSQEVDGNGNANYIGASGNIINGKADSKNE